MMITSEYETLKVTTDEPLEDYNPYRYAAIYARQSQKKESFSIPSQIDTCEKYFHKENLILYKSYEDQESGKKDYEKRKSFVQLLNDIYAGMFKTLIVARMDRLSRNIHDFMKIKNILKKYDVRVIYVLEPELNSSDTSYMTQFIQNMIMAVSTFEPDTINERTSHGRAIARAAGKYKFAKYDPYGYIKDKKEQILIIDPKRSKVIKILFDNYLKLKDISKDSFETLSKELQQMNDSISQEEFKNNPICKPINKIFNKTSIEGIIKRPTYAGLMLKDPKKNLKDIISWDSNYKEYVFDDDELPRCINIPEAIIDEETWKKAVIKLLGPDLDKPSERSEYLFKGLLYCKNCNMPIRVLEENDYYICDSRCTQFTEDQLIKMIVGKIIKDTSQSQLVKIIEKQIDQVKSEVKNQKVSLRKKDKELQVKLKSLLKMPKDEVLRKEYKELNSEKSAIKTLITTLGNKERLLRLKIENINLFKFQMSGFEDNRVIEFVKDNREYFQNIISKIAIKVVLNNQATSGGKSTVIKYIRR